MLACAESRQAIPFRRPALAAQSQQKIGMPDGEAF
jgi:hypothetical protein